MSSVKKKILIASASVTAAGLILLLGLFIKIKFDPKKLNDVPQKITVHDFDSEFTGIYVETEDADVRFVISENNKTTVTCINETKDDIFAISNSNLTVKSVKKKKTGTVANPVIDFREDNAADITIALPAKSIGDFAVITKNGTVEAEDYFLFETVNASLSTENGEIHYGVGTTGQCFIENKGGKIFIENLQCDSIDTRIEAGEVHLDSLELKGKLNIESKKGEVYIDGVKCDSFNAVSESCNLDIKDFHSEVNIVAETESGNMKIRHSDTNVIRIKTVSGDVDASFESPKIYTVTSKSGTVNTPDSLSGGMCDIYSDSGDIRIKIVKPKNTDN